MNTDSSFDKAVSFLSTRISDMLLTLTGDLKKSVREVRLRSGRPIMLTAQSGSFFIYPSGRASMIYADNACVATDKDLSESFNRLCGYSVHSNVSAIAEGFLSLEGGHRAGVCGTAVLSPEGEVSSVRDVNCINLRIAREYPGAANKLYEDVFCTGSECVIVAGPPVSGKTTILRDLARQLSGPARGAYLRVCIADERGEIAASHRGFAQADIGFSDVLTGYPKAKAVMTALRTFSPQVIICDEVGTSEEVAAISEGLNAGVDFVVSAHMNSPADLLLRPAVRELVKSGAFSKLVMLRGGRVPCVIDNIYDIKELVDESGGIAHHNRDLYSFGSISGARPDNACQTA